MGGAKLKQLHVETSKQHTNAQIERRYTRGYICHRLHIGAGGYWIGTEVFLYYYIRFNDDDTMEDSRSDLRAYKLALADAFSLLIWEGVWIGLGLIGSLKA